MPEPARPRFNPPARVRTRRNIPVAARESTHAPESRKAVTGDKPRDLVCQRLAQQARRFPDLDPTGFDARLSPRDAAFAHAMYDATIRRWLTLEHLIRSRLDKPGQPLDMGIQGALLAGAAQMVFLDRVPAHSAINHAVEWVKQAVGTRAGGLVNAVLRRIAELVAGASNLDVYSGGHDEIPMDDGGAIRLPAPVFRGDVAERLAAGTSHPPGFVRALIDHLGFERARAMCLHSLVRPPTVLCTQYDPDAADEHLTTHDSTGHRVWSGDFAGLSALLAARPRVWVQDAASSHAVLGLAARLSARGITSPTIVVDLCAGRGTKTRQLSAEFPEAVALASDTDEDRMKVLRDGAASTGGRIRAIDPPHLADAVRTLRRLRGSQESGGGADLVLLDVPCSNAGTLARRPEAKYRLASDQLARLIPLQREIIAAGAALLTRGGVLIYSTCSIDQSENHDQAAWAASSQGPGLMLLDESQTLPAGLPGDPPSTYRDGSYWALLTKA